jgi:hypothetical protein
VLCFCRPGAARSLYLVGVTLLLPQPELDYIKALASVNNDFVVETSGTADASMIGRSLEALLSGISTGSHVGLSRGSRLKPAGYVGNSRPRLQDKPRSRQQVQGFSVCAC